MEAKKTANFDELYKESIEVLKKYEPSEGYIVSFSGGKDSIVIYNLCKDAGVKFKGCYSVTTIDPPEVTKFIRENYPEIEWQYPMFKGKKTNYYELIKVKGLPTRKTRWCCGCLKENHNNHCTVVLGIRREESYKRRSRPFYQEITKYTKLVNPIIKWTSEDVWWYILSRGFKYPVLYDQGLKRLGCRFCPFSCRAKRIKDLEQYPQMFKLIVDSFQVYLDTHPNFRVIHRDEYKGMTTEEFVKSWWIYESPIESAKGQCISGDAK